MSNFNRIPLYKRKGEEIKIIYNRTYVPGGKRTVEHIFDTYELTVFSDIIVIQGGNSLTWIPLSEILLIVETGVEDLSTIKLKSGYPPDRGSLPK